MKVIFIFPDGDVLIEIEMDSIPRVNERIDFGEIDQDKFQSEEAFQKFKDDEYAYRQWVVEEILWSINNVVGNSATITLQEGAQVMR